ncbi:copper-binding protein [Thauera butanivorans]|jgi:Cu/Ag efflux protein CusF|uniref:copper-binding protein n=1 Tax=Thauera butanivorans TaxID=86174 RepID=UPI000837E37C|nr:copper-binding protein [Thauera butanivorans]
MAKALHPSALHPSTLRISLLASVLILAAPAVALAQAGHDHHGGHGAAATATQADDHSEGTVRKVDAAAGRITIAHGPLPRLDMQPMTMVFGVTDAAMLEGVKAGDRVRFIADKVDGKLVVIELEPLR